MKKARLPLYRDSNAPIDDRVRDVISRMTLIEKVSQMTNDGAAIPRLGIKAYRAFGEGLHGLVHNGIATVFPQSIGLAATWDTPLINRIADAISDEARAKFHLLDSVHGVNPSGLSLWSPNINIFRDLRWGRGQETYGEDPVLTSLIAIAYVKGLQGNHPKYLKIAAGAKHFAVHSGPEKVRHTFNVNIGKKELYETYLPAFKACVDAGVEVIMAAYNRLNGECCCANSTLLKTILREEWGFEGHIVSDGGAIVDVYKNHKAVKTPVEATALSVRNGCNLEAGGSVFRNMDEAVKLGLLTEKEVDEGLFYHYRTRFRLGLFDAPKDVPFTSIPASVINCDKHRKLAHQAAVKSLVLLKNKKNILPLKADVHRIYLTGPSAADQDVFLGNYAGVNNRMPTILEAVVDRAGPTRIVNYRKGVIAHSKSINTDPWEPMTRPASMHDVTIAVMGLNPIMEGEEFDPFMSPNVGDRTDISLPAHQLDFVKKLCSHGKPVILVVTSGSAIAAPEIYDMVDAVLYCWYPGEEGGNAVADVLFGNAVPSGRLPVTVPFSLEGIPRFDDYDMSNRTYRYAKEQPYYPFGFGLSYTTFAYSGIKLKNTTIDMGKSVAVEVTVKNTGDCAAEEVVQLYITDEKASVRVPKMALKNFKRVALKPGKSACVRFTITPAMLALIDDDGKSRVEPGTFRVTIGGACPSARTVVVGGAKPVSAIVRVR